MTDGGRRRLAVLGSPIAHSKSPAIHSAAYRALGLDWDYGRAEVPEGGLAAFVDGLDGTWRGLSLTMPLKREAPALADLVDPLAAELRQANTLLFTDGAIRAFSTDAAGVTGALADAGVIRPRTATVLGGGATAESAVVALRSLGAEAVVAVRSPERAAHLSDRAVVVPLGDAPVDVDVVVSTVPRGEVELDLPSQVDGVLLDVAYEPWPTRVAAAWSAAGGLTVSGLEMLLHQALAQVRIFVGGDPASALPDEPGVWEAMRAAVGLGEA